MLCNCQACYPLIQAGDYTAKLGFIYTYGSMKKTIIWALIAVVLLVALGLVYKMRGPKLITSTDYQMAKLPETLKALPEGFPLEPLNITEQKRIDYPERKSSLYSVVYTSTKSITELVGIYKTYLPNQGYTFTLATSTGSTFITSKKGNDDISISLYPLSDRTSVSISVVTRE